MAEDFARSQQYAYQANSNLVLQADPEARRRYDDATGEVESLVGKINYRMGDRVIRRTPIELAERIQKANEKKLSKRKKNEYYHNKSKKKKDYNHTKLTSINEDINEEDNIFIAKKGSTVLSNNIELNPLLYKPKTEESKRSYNLILNIIVHIFGTQPSEILNGVAEEIVSIIKNDTYRDNIKKDSITNILKGITDDMYTELITLCKQINDFNTNDEKKSKNKNKKKKKNENDINDKDSNDDIDDESDNDTDNENDNDNENENEDDELDKNLGVAVVFDEDEDTDDSELDEIKDDDSDHDEDNSDNEIKSPTKVELTNQNIEESVSSDTTLNNNLPIKEDNNKKKQINDNNNNNSNELNVHSIDAFWLQRKLSYYYKDADISSKLAEDVLLILENNMNDVSLCENNLVNILNYDKFDFIKLLLINRAKVYYITKYKQAQNEKELTLIKKQMLDDIKNNGMDILREIEHHSLAESWMQDRIGQNRDNLRQVKSDNIKNINKTQMIMDDEDDTHLSKREIVEDDDTIKMQELKVLPIDKLVFHEGNHYMSNKEVELPDGTWTVEKKGYKEIHVPAIKIKADVLNKERLINIKRDMPSWTHKAFKNMVTLNRVQSKMYKSAFTSDENLLLCAPTGAGKTNVAVLTILNELDKHRNTDTNTIDVTGFKIVYIAPMKALVQEIVNNLSNRLTESYKINVRELSGDQNLTREQLHSTQIIVTTPEKWDIITRKSGDDRSYTQLVRLLIIDEIHLLHDSRGPVLESIVARTIRQMELNQQMIRLVGLSATLPNYEDVALFLRVNILKELFFFDSSYRPVPLQQQYIGIMEKKPMKQYTLMNEIVYDKIMQQRENRNQIIVFVHSRKETVSTGLFIRDLMIENDVISQFVQPSSATSEILQSEIEKITLANDDLKSLLPYGIGVHHAGMKRTDRNTVENLFADGHLQVLVSTATLAWGVNLPAHTVIIKGTQMYNAEKNTFTELSPLDILQMLGRAGRIQYDTQGEGIIITNFSNLKYYASLMNTQLPVESQLLSKIQEILNAEIVLGSITTLNDATNYLAYTYFFIRMLRNPNLYGVDIMDMKKDKILENYRRNLCHSALILLSKNNLIKYDRKSGYIQSTALGKVSSYYYIQPKSIAIYNEYLKPHMTDIEIFRLFTLSTEFQYIVVRPEEKIELTKLLERVPIPIKENISQGTAKVNVLLQAYISRLSLEGFNLLADMVHIYQSASRIFRGLFEIALYRGWANLCEKLLIICKLVDKRIWLSQSPLRQLNNSNNTHNKKVIIPEAILKKLEKKDISWDRYCDLSTNEIGQLLSCNIKISKNIYKYIHQFPKLEVSAHIQPITRTMLQVEVTIMSDFEYNNEIHGKSLPFWLFVMDVNGDMLYYHDFFLLKEKYYNQEQYLSFTVPLDPGTNNYLPPLYFFKIISDRWLHCENILPITFNKLILPDKNLPCTELLDLQPLAIKNSFHTTEKQEIMLLNAFNRKEVLFPWNFEYYNPIQTQVFNTIYETDNNILIASPSGSGKTLLAELAILRMLFTSSKINANIKRCVYICPRNESCLLVYNDWKYKFGLNGLNQAVCILSGDPIHDLSLINTNNIIISTPENWDIISRRWKLRKIISNINLFIIDNLHLIGNGQYGPTMEIIVSRMRYINANIDDHTIRMIGLSYSLANAHDVAEWMGITDIKNIFNFHPNVRPIPLEIHLQTFDIHNFTSRLLAMAKPTYNAIINNNSTNEINSINKLKPIIILVPSQKQTQLTAIDLTTFSISENKKNNLFSYFTNKNKDYFNDTNNKTYHNLKDVTLKQTLLNGIGFIHENMSETTKDYITHLYKIKKIFIFIIPFNFIWSLSASPAIISCSLLIIMDTKYYDGKEHRYIDYSLTDLYKMLSYCNRPLIDKSNKVFFYCHTSKKQFYAKFLYEPLPIESQLEHFLTDHLNAEIVNKIITNKQEAVDYLTWTFMYKRLLKNPNYYNIIEKDTIHLSDHLSELIENNINQLEESKCIMVDEEDQMSLEPLNLGRIGAYYNIKYTSMELFSCALNKDKSIYMSNLLDIVSSANEFTFLPIRSGEEKKIQFYAKHCKLKIPSNKYSEINVKVNFLLQCYFNSCMNIESNNSLNHTILTINKLDGNFRDDLGFILENGIKLIYAMIDIISSNGWLKPALAAMDLCQMFIQGCWNDQISLVQIPYVNNNKNNILNKIKKELPQIETPTDILNLDDNIRNKIFKDLNEYEMSKVAEFCNQFPDINMSISILNKNKHKIYDNEEIKLKIHISRNIDDDDNDNDNEDDSNTNNNSENTTEKDQQDNIGTVICPNYYKYVNRSGNEFIKKENWWIVIGDSNKNELYFIKRITFNKLKIDINISFEPPTYNNDNNHNNIINFTFQIFFICDSYKGCDLEDEITMDIISSNNKNDKLLSSENNNSSSSSSSSSENESENESSSDNELISNENNSDGEKDTKE